VKNGWSQILHPRALLDDILVLVGVHLHAPSSFPSGHVTRASFLAIVVFAFLPRKISIPFGILALTCAFARMYTEAHKLTPKDPSPLVNRGIIYYTKKGLFDLAIDDFTEALRLNPKEVNALINRGVSYQTRAAADGQTRVVAGALSVPIAGGEGLPGAELKALKTKSTDAIGAALKAANYPTAADPAKINMPLLIAILLLFVVAATALYGPQAAALVEMFPTRVRYTAMSFPYHVGTGWVGGFLPVTSFALVAVTGDIYAGLWYSVVFTGISVIVSLLFLKETAGKPLEDV